MMLNWQTTSILCILLFVTSCGRRQRTIFLFPQEKVVRLATLQFPSPKITNVTQNDHRTTIQWLEVPTTLCVKDTPARLIGYNIYRLTHKGFIPKSPLNKNPITTTSYQDATKTASNHYILRGIFIVQDQMLEGPTSNIGYISTI